MIKRNIAGLILTIIALGILVPGLTKPVFKLNVSGELKSQFANISGEIINNTNSILGTIDELFSQDRTLVAILILFFSAIIPALKGFSVIYAVIMSSKPHSKRIFTWVNMISKWSMADVFVVAILLTFMSTAGHIQSVKQNISVLGMNLPIEIGLKMDSQILQGFYYFLAYCLLSMVAMSVIKITTTTSET